MKPNPRLREVWAAATETTQESQPITLRGLGARTGISSTSIVSYYVDKLIRAGYLAWESVPFYADRRLGGGIHVVIPLGTYTYQDIHIRRKE